MSPRLSLLALIAASAACAATVPIRVTEAAGIRRTAFPAGARVHLSQGALRAPQNARLTLAGKETPAQYSAEALFPDGSVEWLDVDFNASVGPGETQTYQLEYGEGITAAEAPRGLAVIEDADAIQAGNLRFSRSGSPLLLSVKYRGEEIGQGVNGLVVTDAAGQTHDLSNATARKTEIVKKGPLFVVLRYSGSITIDGTYSTPFVITVEMPSSKTMVKVSAAIEDPAKRLREIAIGTPLTFAPLPWVWDLGTSRWTYGSLRNAQDSVTLTQNPAGDWNVQTGPRGREQLYEKSPAGRTEPVQWGHFQDGKEVVAFGMERFKNQGGTWRVTFDGTGQAMFRFAPGAPAEHHDFSVFEHFITTPVQIGAATSPTALLSPLMVDVGSPTAR
jgi:hypothetical protein